MWIKNEKGQMAVFVALFFQVLFVFFAMIINMGLVIHDKINLQNAVDIAAYYGAAKQAEVLNQIAHINYQMRQNYKLLVWRFRVLGTINNDDHPYGKNVSIPAENLVKRDKRYLPSPPPPSRANMVTEPAICIGGDYWYEYKNINHGAEGWCKKSEFDTPPIPQVDGMSGVVPGGSEMVRMANLLREELKIECLETSLFNWIWAARILTHFRLDGYMRKIKIRKLAENLSAVGKEFEDLRGDSVKTGVINTVKYNLTDSNRKNVHVEYFNSMAIGEGKCQLKEWLPEIKIMPAISYLKLKPKGGGSCKAITTVYNRGKQSLPEWSNFRPEFQNFRNKKGIEFFEENWKTEGNGLFHSSVGFEKNPWCQVYTGVAAVTRVTKPFSPGGAITLKARGFAKPFGGRIGPWYGRTWPKGADQSQASNQNEMVDGLLPERKVDDNNNNNMNLDDRHNLANYSRYPGDTLGLKSSQALAALHKEARKLLKPNGGDALMTWANYDHLGSLRRLEITGDGLARPAKVSSGKVVGAPQRKFELAAIAPDVFDALYYSIEPRYYNNYFGSSTGFGKLFPEEERIYDFGSYKDNPELELKPSRLRSYSIMDQVKNATGPDGLYHPSVRYIIRNWHHLLTSWHQKAAVDYKISELFGNCKDGDTDDIEEKKSRYPTTGNCVAGGRTGYSVKNVSMDFLCSSDHNLSGGDAPSGSQIENYPQGSDLLSCPPP